MAAMKLVDTTPFQYQILEDNKATGRMVVQGVFQREGVENENRRVYPKGLFEKVLNDPKIQERVNKRGMFGELDHPPDGKTQLTRVSHIITNAWRDKDGTVYGEAEILDTPRGKVLQELFRRNTNVGISSRGQGTLGSNNMVEDDYRLDTWDFVANPSTPGAWPKVVAEEILLMEEGMQEFTEDEAVAKLHEIQNHLDTLNESQDSDPANLVERALKLITYRNNLSNIKKIDEEKFGEVTGALLESVEEMQNTIAPKIDYPKVDYGRRDVESNVHIKQGYGIKEAQIEGGTNMSTSITEAKDRQFQEDVKSSMELIQEQISSLKEDSELQGLYEDKYVTAVAVIEELRNRYNTLGEENAALAEKLGAATSIIEAYAERGAGEELQSLNEDVTALSEERDATKALLEEALDRYATVQSDYEDLAERYDALHALMEAVVDRSQQEVMTAKIEHVLESHPRADAIRPLLEECQSPAELEERIGVVNALTEGLVPEDEAYYYEEDFDDEPLPGGDHYYLTEEEQYDDEDFQEDAYPERTRTKELNEGAATANKVTKKLRWR